MKNVNSDLQIYVACLAAYNEGYLHGAWIDANQSSEDIWNDVQQMLAKSPVPFAEEWAIHDFDLGGVRISECTSFEKISNIAAFISEHGDLGAAVLAETNDIDDAKKILEDSYHGEFDSEEDFAYYWTNEVDCTKIPSHIECYIDYKAMARDFFCSDFFSISLNYKTHVFSHT